MTKHWGAFSWILGQIICFILCVGIVSEHGWLVGGTVWSFMTILLDIRFKIKGYYE